MITKTVQRVDHEGNVKTLATFTLGSTVMADYQSHSFRRQIESDGIKVGGVRLWPKDGKAFFDGLDKEFANSSTIHVLTSTQKADEADFDESKHPRESDGKFGAGGGAGGSASSSSKSEGPKGKIEAKKAKNAQAFADRAQRHSTALNQLAQQHPDHPQIQAAARVAAEHAQGAKDHPEHAEHHAEGAERQVKKLREHGESEGHHEGGHGEGEHGGEKKGGHWFQDLLKLISGVHG